MLLSLIRFLILTSCLITSSFAEEIKGSITFLKGRAFVVRGMRTLPAKIGTELMAGDIVAVEDSSQLTIDLINTGLLKITEKTKFEIPKEEAQKERTSSLSLFFGGIWTEAKKLLQGESFEIKTPTATAGVRGTRFATNFNPSTNSMSAMVEEGQVVAFTPDGTSVSLFAGMVAQTGDGGLSSRADPVAVAKVALKAAVVQKNNSKQAAQEAIKAAQEKQGKLKEAAEKAASQAKAEAAQAKAKAEAAAKEKAAAAEKAKAEAKAAKEKVTQAKTAAEKAKAQAEAKAKEAAPQKAEQAAQAEKAKAAETAKAAEQKAAAKAAAVQKEAQEAIQESQAQVKQVQQAAAQQAPAAAAAAAKAEEAKKKAEAAAKEKAAAAAAEAKEKAEAAAQEEAAATSGEEAAAEQNQEAEAQEQTQDSSTQTQKEVDPLQELERLEQQIEQQVEQKAEEIKQQEEAQNPAVVNAEQIKALTDKMKNRLNRLETLKTEIQSLINNTALSATERYNQIQAKKQEAFSIRDEAQSQFTSELNQLKDLGATSDTIALVEAAAPSFLETFNQTIQQLQLTVPVEVILDPAQIVQTQGRVRIPVVARGEVLQIEMDASEAANHRRVKEIIERELQNQAFQIRQREDEMRREQELLRLRELEERRQREGSELPATATRDGAGVFLPIRIE